MPEPPEPSIYQLRAVLLGISPIIWRRLLVRGDSTIADLHVTLQTAFGWSGDHLHRFLIFPQSPDNNRGPWEKAERFERDLALASREVYIIAGGVGSQAGFKGIDVPESTWKVFVALERSKSFPSGQEKAQVFAVIMPNHEGISDDRWQEYQIYVSEIGKKTGYRFFKNAPVIESIAKTAGRF